MPDKEIDLKPFKDKIKEIEEEMLDPLPTPPVGTPVVWYKAADSREGAERSALVTRVEGPGKVTLTIFPPNSVPLFNIQNILHVSHPTHEKRSNAVSITSGSWDYMKGHEPGEKDYELHLSRLEAKKRSVELQLEEAEAIKKKQEETPPPNKAKSAKQTTKAATTA